MNGPWTLRRRLMVTVGLIILLVSVFIAITVSALTRQALIERVDEDLLVFAGRIADAPEPPVSAESARSGFAPFAVIHLDPHGAVLDERPAGFPDRPDPLPDMSQLTAADLEAEVLITVDAVSGDGSTRVLVRQRVDGYDVMASSLDEVESTALQALWTSLRVSLLSALVGIAATWLLVRRGFRPVNAMIETAGAIAEGDLSSRTDLVESSTELGELSKSLDHMLERIEKADRERLREAERLRRFASDASHELRTPIAAIVGYAELYRDGGVQSQEALDRAMARIAEASERAGRLIEDLLALARLDREIGINRSRLDLGALVSDIVEDARVSTGRDIRCHVKSTTVVKGDSVWLRQAVENLMRNAVAHAPDSGPIELIVDSEGAIARLRVVDHGPGVPESERELVFDRFARPDSARDRTHGGTGLGLAIVREVVESHDGQVVITETPGGGATAEILLPLDPESDTGS